jgi:hypothetical protein
VKPADCPPGLRAVVLGGASCFDRDLQTLEDLAPSWPELVIAVNDAGIDWPNLDHWASLHPMNFPRWESARNEAGHPRSYTTWGIERSDIVDRIHRGWAGGSSGLFGVSLALQELQCSRVVLVGIPMDARPNRFRDEKGWDAHSRYWSAWSSAWPDLRHWVRSMSGWTRRLLGPPDPVWLESRTPDVVPSLLTRYTI